jgi:hypothetical protein
MTTKTEMTMQDDSKPGTRKLWRALIDRAISNGQRRGEALTVEAVLNSCGIFSWAPSRQRAHAYATKMLNTTEGKR